MTFSMDDHAPVLLDNRTLCLRFKKKFKKFKSILSHKTIFFSKKQFFFKKSSFSIFFSSKTYFYFQIKVLPNESFSNEKVLLCLKCNYLRSFSSDTSQDRQNREHRKRSGYRKKPSSDWLEKDL